MSTAPFSLAERVRAHLRTGATVSSIAGAEGVSPVLVEILVDDLERRGLASQAESLCASGLGACSGGDSPQVALHCAGCPLVPLRPRSA
ncbi:hypothetical protein [Actinomyces minihominis]|uniref:hypothetical protein n=1 Tax=Actinomyces minihominis TaxID=2002838 RepID=UPI00101AE227|nr:hypothetical protein [Actinomyces minihominis]